MHSDALLHNRQGKGLSMMSQAHLEDGPASLDVSSWPVQDLNHKPLQLKALEQRPPQLDGEVTHHRHGPLAGMQKRLQDVPPLMPIQQKASLASQQRWLTETRFCWYDMYEKARA